MSDETQAMDVYSDRRVPFAIAAWCRQHKLHRFAVDLRRKLQEQTEVHSQLLVLEDKDRLLFNDIKGLIDKIEGEDARETAPVSAAPVRQFQRAPRPV